MDPEDACKMIITVYLMNAEIVNSDMDTVIIRFPSRHTGGVKSDVLLLVLSCSHYTGFTFLEAFLAAFNARHLVVGFFYMKS